MIDQKSHVIWGYKYDSLNGVPTAQCECGKMSEAINTQTEALENAHRWHIVEVQRHEMYKTYLNTTTDQIVMSFDEWMVSRGYGYSTVDRRWVLA